MRRIRLIVPLVIAALLGLACGKQGLPDTSALSGDDRHKLYQAAMNARDAKLLTQVTEALGLAGQSGSPTPASAQFINEHRDWASKNFDFVKENLDPVKAKEYVRDHLPR